MEQTANNTARYDIAILGTGPAGVSAAITAKLRGKRVLLLGSPELSDKLGKAHTILNYTGLPGITGAGLAAALGQHLQAMDQPITPERITAVYAMGEYFALQAASGAMYESAAVILATGITAAKPYPGELEFLGRGVSYCATCDAPLYRGKTVAVIGGAPGEEAEANYLAEVCGTVYYLPLYPGAPQLDARVKLLAGKPLGITGGQTADTLQTDAGELAVDCVFILRESVAPAQLVPGLALDGPAVAVDRRMATNLPGCFACGDVVGKPYQYIKAAGEGNVAALSAVEYLSAMRN